MSTETTRREFMQSTSAAMLGGSVLVAADPAAAPAAEPDARKFLGITVLPEYVQSEGIDGVLENLIGRAGANAVATSPYVMEEADKKTGKREPPADAGAGNVRLLDRPLFGKREVWVRTAPSFVPDTKQYKGLRYQPPPATELTSRDGPIVERFITASKRAGLKVYFQVQAVIPPGYRVQFGGPTEDDQPRLPDGRIPPRRLAANGSLASPHILDYEHALIRDLCAQYPEIDGIRFDWPEYPPYMLDSVFLDFSDHARTAAKRLGFDFDLMLRDVGALYKKLHGGLTDRDLENCLDDDGGRYHLLRTLSDNPGLGQWLRFKAVLVEEMLQGFRGVMDESGGRQMEMMPNAFPPPFTIASGMDFRRVAKYSSAISCKLYSMHWAMILRFYGDQILKANPGLSSHLLARVLARWLDIADDAGLDRVEDYSYPPPDAPHPVGLKAMARKISQAQADAGATPIYSLAHGYGPLDDFQKRLAVAWNASHHGMWVNRYAYLTDAKLDAVKTTTRA